MNAEALAREHDGEKPRIKQQRREGIDRGAQAKHGRGDAGENERQRCQHEHGGEREARDRRPRHDRRRRAAGAEQRRRDDDQDEKPEMTGDGAAEGLIGRERAERLDGRRVLDQSRKIVGDEPGHAWRRDDRKNDKRHQRAAIGIVRSERRAPGRGRERQADKDGEQKNAERARIREQPQHKAEEEPGALISLPHRAPPGERGAGDERHLDQGRVERAHRKGDGVDADHDEGRDRPLPLTHDAARERENEPTRDRDHGGPQHLHHRDRARRRVDRLQEPGRQRRQAGITEHPFAPQGEPERDLRARRRLREGGSERPQDRMHDQRADDEGAGVRAQRFDENRGLERPRLLLRSRCVHHFYSSMILSENRYPLFGIMLYSSMTMPWAAMTGAKERR